MRAAAALRVQRLPIGPDPLREIVKAADQSLNQVQAASAPPASAPVQSDQPLQVEPFNPIEDENGQRRNPRLQQIAATIIHAIDRDDQGLLNAAATLLGAYLDAPGEMVVHVAGGIGKWHNKPNAWPNMPRPLSVADCGRVTERILAQRQAGGDDRMGNRKGLPPDRVPPRKPPSKEDFGID
jgi:hypothetical protein